MLIVYLHAYRLTQVLHRTATIAVFVIVTHVHLYVKKGRYHFRNREVIKEYLIPKY